ncbi:hypothetical protein EJ05DRAFT_490217 [Pseudovirgaria hyperparasitica]|uniref:Uncharacterized protein n=1 Tax=Pseudovirgaria hyperparasitica TaxID=470096 RepID=A0A6A6VUS0_9PEZI|nr:uncharacterized protein EJ05DRAFT_490217 [Pseudovirgaria hyperparasitica]KAF2753536.1 hypothetical protein EJ05DRAFT_490217 [Pseudovirgaria hyperparasitica]
MDSSQQPALSRVKNEAAGTVGPKLESEPHTHARTHARKSSKAVHLTTLQQLSLVCKSCQVEFYRGERERESEKHRTSSALHGTPNRMRELEYINAIITYRRSTSLLERLNGRFVPRLAGVLVPDQQTTTTRMLCDDFINRNQPWEDQQAFRHMGMGGWPSTSWTDRTGQCHHELVTDESEDSMSMLVIWSAMKHNDSRASSRRLCWWLLNGPLVQTAAVALTL